MRPGSAVDGEAGEISLIVGFGRSGRVQYQAGRGFSRWVIPRAWSSVSSDVLTHHVSPVSSRLRAYTSKLYVRSWRSGLCQCIILSNFLDECIELLDNRNLQGVEVKTNTTRKPPRVKSTQHQLPKCAGSSSRTTSTREIESHSPRTSWKVYLARHLTRRVFDLPTLR